MRRMVGSLSRLSRGVLWTRGKITDTVMARKERVELTEDELFFEQNDQDPTELLLAGLERDRKLLAEKEALGRDTPEWKLYEEEVDAVTKAIEDEWITRAEPITKETVRIAQMVREEAVEKVQAKHQKLNDHRIAAYQEYKKAITSGGSRVDERELPVSPEYAALLDKYK